MSCILGTCIAAIGLHIGSAHINPDQWLKDKGINDFNPGVMVEFDNGATLGGYLNTLRGQSNYAGYTHHFARDWKAHPVAQVGFVTYGDKTYLGGNIGLQGNISGKWDARLVYVPKVAATGAHVIHLLAVRNL